MKAAARHVSLGASSSLTGGASTSVQLLDGAGNLSFVGHDADSNRPSELDADD
jgi:hypothetical protein